MAEVITTTTYFWQKEPYPLRAGTEVIKGETFDQYNKRMRATGEVGEYAADMVVESWYKMHQDWVKSNTRRKLTLAGIGGLGIGAIWFLINKFRK